MAINIVSNGSAIGRVFTTAELRLWESMRLAKNSCERRATVRMDIFATVPPFVIWSSALNDVLAIIKVYVNLYSVRYPQYPPKLLRAGIIMHRVRWSGDVWIMELPQEKRWHHDPPSGPWWCSSIQMIQYLTSGLKFSRAEVVRH